MGDEHDTKVAVDLALLKQHVDQLEKRVTGMETKAWGVLGVIGAYILSGLLGLFKIGGGP